MIGGNHESQSLLVHLSQVLLDVLQLEPLFRFLPSPAVVLEEHVLHSGLHYALDTSADLLSLGRLRLRRCWLTSGCIRRWRARLLCGPAGLVVEDVVPRFHNFSGLFLNLHPRVLLLLRWRLRLIGGERLSDQRQL